MMIKFSGKVGLVQRVLPKYRAPFFNALGIACEGGLGIFAGSPRPEEMIKSVSHLDHADLTHGKNLHIFKNGLYLCFQIGLMDWLTSLDPDVLIIEANPRYIRSQSAAHWMHKRDRPVIGWGLGAPSPSGLFKGFRVSRRRQIINQFDAMITYSQAGASEYAQLGFPQENIFTAINAVTPPPAHPYPERPIRSAGEKSRVLFVGRLQERKNLENLIIACSTLAPTLQPELVIVGDGPARSNLETLAADNFPNTIFTGALYNDALAAQFREADIFVLPGTGGLAVQQAMSFGLPIIAAEADGTQEDLVRSENGWQIPPDDIHALTVTLQEALSNIEGLREMGKESYRIVSEEVNLDQMVAVFIEALNRSISWHSIS
ncbi:MAG: glycosyltransferase family 4 protein [Chloroflexota bacterium]|nr:glycosyltransferase family 4 protein [Chloroflexota bacterium]